MNIKSFSIFLILLLLLGVFSLWHLAAGAINIDFLQVIKTLRLGSGEHHFVINDLRLPRMIIAILVGAALALSGLLVQGVIRNPLASPDILGITSGASLAVVILSIVWPNVPTHIIPTAALIGGFTAAAILLLFAKHLLNRPATFALVGIALTALFGAAIDYLLTVNPLQINTAMLWLTGSVWGRNWQHIPLISSWLLVLIPIGVLMAYRLDLLGLGDDMATNLGTSVNKVRLVSLIVAVCLASSAVSVAGSIGFVGLIAPHLARSILGHRHILLIPAVLVIGAILVVSADLFARIIMPPLELPAGVLTAFIGAPYFIYLLSRYKNW